MPCSIFRLDRWLGLLVALPLLAIADQTSETSPTRRFVFRYEVRVPAIEAGQGPVDIFVPLPIESAQQGVLEYAIGGNVSGTIERDAVYGNRFFRGRVDRATGEPLEVVLRAVIERRSPRSDFAAGAGAGETEKFLRANERVVVGHEILDPILAEVRLQAGSRDKVVLSRAIYDWVVDNVEYKKVGTGWGNGDTFWACNERYGNCTDFHSLLISLARTEGIPARFEMGFPVPADKAEGKIGGYHCWVEVHLEDEGWIPLDASEASKQPAQRDAFYGVQRGDRVHMSTGRDLRLGSEHQDSALNYFVFPYVEVDGKRFEGAVEKELSYRVIESG